ncbi:hypothetical protein BgiMline_005802 [Biomphalaria glabrata]|nr:hypothetical protein BgiMline_003804 [Biomphalaria glabrata]
MSTSPVVLQTDKTNGRTDKPPVCLLHLLYCRQTKQMVEQTSRQYVYFTCCTADRQNKWLNRQAASMSTSPVVLQTDKTNGRTDKPPVCLLHLLYCRQTKQMVEQTSRQYVYFTCCTADRQNKW